MTEKKSINIQDSAKLKHSKSGACRKQNTADNRSQNLVKTLFPIVGIGASAGGLVAFETFFKALPADSGIAFVVIAHLDPTHVSILPDLLQKSTQLPVGHIKNGTLVKPDHIYVIPPDKKVHLRKGKLCLTKLSQSKSNNLPIDTFFISLAKEQQSRAIGIILSGTGSDGTLGVKAIKEEMGMVIAQDEETASYNGMPQNAINTGLVDFILSPYEMPQQLIQYIYQVSKSPEINFGISQDKLPGLLDKIFIILRNRTGHDFSQYKKNTICRRIERRMTLHHIEDLSEYTYYLNEHDEEVQDLFKELLIGVTNFFRDTEAFLSLEEHLVPLLRKKPDNYTFRVWVAGCSSGEEAYSIAILLRECQTKVRQNYKFQIFSTDIDEAAIKAARAGIFPQSICAEVSEKRLKRFFVKEENEQYRISKSIRETVVFAEQNIIKDPPFTKLDLICCRNLLIYLGPELQDRVLPMFHYSLKPDGLLFLGTSESIGQNSDLFHVEDKKWKIFQRKSTSTGRTPRFNLPLSSADNENNEDIIMSGKMKKAEELSALQLIETILLESNTPPCAIIDESCNIIYIHGHTGNYLEPAEGRTSINILDMARPGLKGMLANVIRQVNSENKAVKVEDIRVRKNGTSLHLNLTVKPVFEHGNIKGMMMVKFEEQVADKAIKPTQKNQFEPIGGDKAVLALEQELQHNRENLQLTIEELEASNEELKSTNEELQSTNEELQSTNEELETSKEELQSLNEESSTVNAELQSRIDELSKTNDDMKNLLDSTEIATIFLDIDLCIRRFTPPATRIIPLDTVDTGRPIKHFATNLVNVDLVNYASQVLDDLIVQEIEVTSEEGQYFQMRLRPYRTLANVIDGVVITFEDITVRKEAEQERQTQSELMRYILDIVPDPVAIKGINAVYTLANKAFCNILGKSSDEIIGKSNFDLFPQENANRFQKLEAKVSNSGHEQTITEEIKMPTTVLPVAITWIPVKATETGGVSNILVSMKMQKR